MTHIWLNDVWSTFSFSKHSYYYYLNGKTHVCRSCIVAFKRFCQKSSPPLWDVPPTLGGPLIFSPFQITIPKTCCFLTRNVTGNRKCTVQDELQRVTVPQSCKWDTGFSGSLKDLIVGRWLSFCQWTLKNVIRKGSGVDIRSYVLS